MSYGEDICDIGGYYARLDYIAEECEEDCKNCRFKYECPSSDYNKKKDWWEDDYY